MKTPSIQWLCAVICLSAGMLLFPVPDARAEFYKYKDNSGAVVITNKLEDVPKIYRKRVKVVWDAELEAKDPLARRHALAEKHREQREAREAQQVKQEKQKPAGNGISPEGKTLVISIDDQTGEVIRRFE